MLTLPIKKKWFDMILNGEKKEEYREIKPYYTSRFEKTLCDVNKQKRDEYTIYKTIKFRNGYSNKSLYLVAIVSIKKGIGKIEWGAELNKRYYVLKILEIKEVGGK